MTTEDEALKSPFKHVFEQSRRILIDEYDENETENQRKVRNDSFRVLYDTHVKVIGHVKRSTWRLPFASGLRTPVDMSREIKLSREIGKMLSTRSI